MVKSIKQNDKELYRCEECGFHYEAKEWAEKCEAWCKEHQMQYRNYGSRRGEQKDVIHYTISCAIPA